MYAYELKMCPGVKRIIIQALNYKRLEKVVHLKFLAQKEVGAHKKHEDFCRESLLIIVTGYILKANF